MVVIKIKLGKQIKEIPNYQINALNKRLIIDRDKLMNLHIVREEVMSNIVPEKFKLPHF
jgi:hypothetical protein